MGVGISSAQQVVGSIAAAGIIAGQSKAEADKQGEQGLLAKEQFHEAKADLAELEGQSVEAEKELKEKAAISDALELKKPGGKGNTKKALEEKRAAALTEKEAAQRAFDTLSDKMEAKKAMMLRAQMIMKRTGVKE